ncbi:LuxR C-terminal-related transcriptional regulator [Paeniglutamicibacter sp. MACA_103]|uniref:LuxR C-terminal-related transcriptional regulator n=1 Tax=Paeniglutamicibacter sp. MACA_103 TaxID=3377337 RepID=UPI003893DD60
MSILAQRDREDSLEYRELLDIVTSPEPSGAIVLGSIGMGKTSLVEAVLAHPDAPAPVMRLFCSPTLADVPYGALSPYLGSLQRIEGPVEVLREINKRLESAAMGNLKPVVVVEDAHHLDAESAFVLSLLMENAALKLIAIGAGVLASDSSLATLSDSEALSTIVVQPLGLDGVRAHVEELVGGRISEGTARIILATSGGNPSFVQAYVYSCREQGILFSDRAFAHQNGDEPSIWILARPLPAADDRLTDLVTEIHGLTPPAEQRTLEMLALGGPLPGKLLAACGCPYRHLLGSGELRQTSDSTIRISSALHEAVLRRIVTAQRKAELFALWEGSRQDLGLHPTPTQVLWGIEIGVETESEVALRAVQQAADSLDFELAWKLCTASEMAAKTEQGALLEATVLMGMGRYHSSRSLLVRLMEQTHDATTLTTAFKQLLIVLSNLGAEAHDREVIEQLWEHRAGQFDESLGLDEIVKGHRTAELILDYWNSLNTPDAARPLTSELEFLLEDPEMVPEGRLVVLSLLSDLHSIEGHNETALGLARQVLEGLGRYPRLEGIYQSNTVFRVGWNLIFSGRYFEAKEFIDSYRGNSIHLIVHRQGMLALLHGLGDLLQGRKANALDEFAEAVMELRLRDPAQLLALASCMYEWASGHVGVSVPGSWSGAPLGPENDDGLRAKALTDSPSARRLFARAVAASIGNALGHEKVTDFPLMEREMLLFGTAQLDHGELLGHPSQERLATVLEGHQGSRAGFVARLVTLRGRNDAEALESLGREALHQGEYRIGTEALTRAALRYLAEGEPRVCGAILRQVGRIIEEQGLVAENHIARALAFTELTAREKEIVDLARSGMNNARIARELTVSQRTVEGHLYRVFSKLGISERSELNAMDLEPGNGST